MATKLEEIEHQIDQLTKKERILLIHNLIVKLDEKQEELSQEELDKLWSVEANRRYNDYLTGNSHAEPLEDVMKEIRLGLK